MSAYFEMTPKQYADHIGVSKQTVWSWMREKRIAFRNPADGVYLIKRTEKRPEKELPWGRGNKFYCQS
jgi:hypothetical protein